jgi:ureidoacrylate peracid hydrolase
MSSQRFITFDASPDPIQVDADQTAVIVVDMQNAFAKRGGYMDLAGYDISKTEHIIEPCRKIITVSRKSGIKIIYFQMGCSSDMSEVGAEGSPFYRKSKGIDLIRKNPEFKDKSYIYGTWGAEIIDELRPRDEDIVIKKQRYDGFIGTNLELVLSTLGIRFLIFIGTATNVCVESTLRHAFFLDYYPILVSDAVSALGADILQEATVHNVQAKFGWVISVEKLVEGVDRAATKQ